VKSSKRTTFYPDPRVQEVLRGAEPKKVSERINELILKGLSKEKEEQVRAEYERYAHDLAETESRKKNKQGVSTSMMMASGLFVPEDEPDDWF
jgi:hypothetical protein